MIYFYWIYLPLLSQNKLSEHEREKREEELEEGDDRTSGRETGGGRGGRDGIEQQEPWQGCPVMPGLLTGNQSDKQSDCEDRNQGKTALDSACGVCPVQVAPGIIHSPTHCEQHPTPLASRLSQHHLNHPSLFVHWLLRPDRPPCSSAEFPWTASFRLSEISWKTWMDLLA